MSHIFDQIEKALRETAPPTVISDIKLMRNEDKPGVTVLYKKYVQIPLNIGLPPTKQELREWWSRHEA
jgi:hypothetical protein